MEHIDALPADFWRYVVKTDTCWYWYGAMNEGYGVIMIDRRRYLVHRLMYRLFIGEVPEGMVIHHRCRTTDCVNPDHLELMTRSGHTMHHERLKKEDKG